MPPFLQPFDMVPRISDSGYPFLGSVVLLVKEQHDLCRVKSCANSMTCE